MVAMPFLGNGTLLFEDNLPRVLPVTIYKHASCLIPYIDFFLFLCGEWYYFKQLWQWYIDRVPSIIQSSAPSLGDNLHHFFWG